VQTEGSLGSELIVPAPMGLALILLGFSLRGVSPRLAGTRHPLGVP
jgi:hypothetical protein